MIFKVLVLCNGKELCRSAWVFMPRIGEHIKLLGRIFKVSDVLYELKDGQYGAQPVTVNVVLE